MHIIYLFLIFSLSAFANTKVEPVKMGATAFEFDGKNLLALSFSNDKKWHTYWKNPGDAGTEIKVQYKVDGESIELKDYPWPTPKRYIEQGNMWAYGYGEKYALFFELKDELKNKTLNINANWLVCKEICIPGEKIIDLSLDSNLQGKLSPQLETSKLKDIFSNLPKPGGPRFDFFLNKGEKENQLALNYVIENADFNEVSKKSSVVYPYLQFPFDFKHEEIYFDKANKLIYGRIYIDWDGIYEEPVWEMPKDGVFKKPITAKFLVTYPLSKPATIVEKSFKQFSLTGDKAMSDLFSKLGGEKPKTQKSENSLLLVLLFGFLGGLILNLMPCVLPVISLKLFGLVVHSDESKSKILKHNLAYTAGVLSSFLVLATVILAIKSTGSKIGWGFQLQSPLFVFFMLILMFVMALNMLGLFEFATPGGKTLGNTKMKEGFFADFFNGILATILSTPCSAPFLGTALTYAFTTSTFNIYIVFTAIALGLAAPFLLTGFFPSLVKFLPKPGAWMEKLKNILGLTLLLTAVWLYDILDGLINLEFAGLYINTILVLTFFAFYFRKHISKAPLWNVLLFSLPFLLFAQSLKIKAFDVQEISNASKNTQWSRWSKQKLDSQKGLTFVNFTATWCLTCKVNKKLVLDTDDFRDLVKEKGVTLLEGDWTKRDEEITEFLQSYGIVGVPAYFIKNSKGEIISLGETISISKIKQHLK